MSTKADLLTQLSSDTNIVMLICQLLRVKILSLDIVSSGKTHNPT